MRSDTPIDYALFQLSPKRSRCELFVSQSGNTEKLASGSVKPFTTCLKVAEERVAASAQSIELKVNKQANGNAAWFNKGTLERFVQYVNSPDILEQLNTYDAEMSQLESALKIYTEGLGDQSTSASGGEGAKAAADATKRELIRAIDVRLTAVKQDMSSSCVRASMSGFNPDAISDLRLFADQFGASRLKETCEKLTTLWQRRPDLVKQTWQKSKTTQANDRAVRSSTCSDMSLDDPSEHDEGDDNNPSSGPRHELPTNPQKAEPGVNEEGSSPSSGPSAIQANQPSRRLSVQDRIKLFENKQDSSGSKPAAAAAAPEKIHSRRLSSDASSSQDRGVLRRWSGASDMSIDTSGEKSLESPQFTPLSPSVSIDKSGSVSGICTDSSKNQKSLSDYVNLDKTKVVDTDVVSGGDEEVVLKDQGSSVADRMRSKKEQFELKRQGSFQERQRVSSVDECKDLPETEKTGHVDVQSNDGSLKGKVPYKVEESHFRSQATRKTSEFPSKIRDSFVSHIKSKTFVPQSESAARHESPVTPVAPSRDVGGQYSPPPMGSYSEEVVIEKRVLVSTTKLSHGGEDSDTSNTWEITDKQYNEKPVFFSKSETESSAPSISMTSVNGQRVRQSKGNQELNDELQLKANELEKLFAAHSVDQAQKVKQSKGNHGLNDELQFKANELEKLFAEHKLRVPGDQSASTRRNKQSESNVEQTANLPKKSLEPATVTLPKTSSLAEFVGSNSTMTKSRPSSQTLPISVKDIPEISAPKSSKGKSYTRYMQKREAKLREEWGVNRAEKEAKMKAMLDSLERSNSEMKATFSGLVDKNGTVSSARRHTERFRSFNVLSTARREQPVDYFEHDEVDEEYEFRDQKTYGQQKKFSEEAVPESVSHGNQNKKVNKSISSSTPRTPGLPVSRSATKANSLASGKRKPQAENPLAQSVPNFADFRNEKAKPPGGGKITPRSQPKTFARSRSTIDETNGIKEEKSRRSQSLRKSYANPVEFKDMSALSSDLDVLPPNKLSNKSESKSFLRKGNGIGPGAGANVAKMKATMTSEVPKNEEESGDFVTEPEDDNDLNREEEVEVEEFDTKTEEYNDVDNEQIELNQDAGKFSDSGSGNDDAMGSHLLQDSTSASELPVTETSIFQARGSVQESPTESLLSWNAHMHHSFSYPQETSDIEASVDSPMGSPASWNSHSMTQSEAEAVRMRKKWGSAHKPFVANSSQSHSRKDMTKGFKRLLKFGRKSRGTETLVDWISATTSEGDDDTEDGRDPASRSSDDLRKSRMGFIQSHPSEDGFNESDLFSEQAPANFKFRDDQLSGSALKAPRSFFSLSSFRSKGSESKAR